MDNKRGTHTYPFTRIKPTTGYKKRLPRGSNYFIIGTKKTRFVNGILTHVYDKNTNAFTNITTTSTTTTNTNTNANTDTQIHIQIHKW